MRPSASDSRASTRISRAATATSSRTTGEGPSPLMLFYRHAPEHAAEYEKRAATLRSAGVDAPSACESLRSRLRRRLFLLCHRLRHRLGICLGHRFARECHGDRFPWQRRRASNRMTLSRPCGNAAGLRPPRERTLHRPRADHASNLPVQRDCLHHASLRLAVLTTSTVVPGAAASWAAASPLPTVFPTASPR